MRPVVGLGAQEDAGSAEHGAAVGLAKFYWSVARIPKRVYRSPSGRERISVNIREIIVDMVVERVFDL